jgi:hypothetical protein
MNNVKNAIKRHLNLGTISKTAGNLGGKSPITGWFIETAVKLRE